MGKSNRSKKLYSTVAVVDEKDDSTECTTKSLPEAELVHSQIHDEENTHHDMVEENFDDYWTKGEVQPLQYRDKKFAVAFLIHLAILIIASIYAPPTIKTIITDIENIEGIHRLRKGRILRRTNTLDQLKRIEKTDQEIVEKIENNAYEVALEQGKSSNVVGVVENIVGDYEQELDPSEIEQDLINSHRKRSPLRSIDRRKFIKYAIVTTLSSISISLVFVLMTLFCLQRHSEQVIKGSLFFIIIYFIINGITALFMMPNVSDFDELYEEDEEDQRLMTQQADEDGKAVVAVSYFVLAALFIIYALVVWRKIPFASSTLKTGVVACRCNMGVFFFAFFTPTVNLLFFILQAMSTTTFLNASGVFGDEQSPIGIICTCIFFLLSFYWTAEVVKNISTASVSFTVGKWWFAPLEASSCCSAAVVDSIKRALTYSFGSICLGSLVVSILSVLVEFCRSAQKSKCCILLVCVLQCILKCIENLADCFNKWGIIYVGLYGYDFKTAGKNVIALFKSRGWSAIISNNLVMRALFMVATFIGLSSGLIITLVLDFSQISDGNDNADKFISIIFFYASFCVSFLTANALLSVVGAASDTAIVCFAEASREFESNHPFLSAMMHETYDQVRIDASEHEII